MRRQGQESLDRQASNQVPNTAAKMSTHAKSKQTKSATNKKVKGGNGDNRTDMELQLARVFANENI